MDRRGTSLRRSSSAPCSGAPADGCSARQTTSAACAPAGRTPRSPSSGSPAPPRSRRGSSPGRGASPAPRSARRRLPGWAQSPSGIRRQGFLLEKFPDGAPDVLLGAEPARADRQGARPQFAEQLRELSLARAVGGNAAGLHVACLIPLPREHAERVGRDGAVFRSVLAVGGVEKVHIEASRVVARGDDFAR